MVPNLFRQKVQYFGIILRSLQDQRVLINKVDIAHMTFRDGTAVSMVIEKGYLSNHLC